MTASSWTEWRRDFEGRAARALPDIPAHLDEGGADRAALAACLARFQLAEAGGRRFMAQLGGVACDPDHERALTLFVHEERRHAEILTRLVRSHGGEVLPRSTGHRLFSWLRNLVGVRWKLFVLDVAEVVGVSCYERVITRLPAGPTRAALEEIVRDEERHLRFHSAFVGRALGVGWRRPLLAACWWIVGLGACAAAILDVGPALSSLGVARRDLAGAMLHRLQEGARHLRAAAS